MKRCILELSLTINDLKLKHYLVTIEISEMSYVTKENILQYFNHKDLIQLNRNYYLTCCSCFKINIVNYIKMTYTLTTGFVKIFLLITLKLIWRDFQEFWIFNVYVWVTYFVPWHNNSFIFFPTTLRLSIMQQYRIICDNSFSLSWSVVL